MQRGLDLPLFWEITCGLAVVEVPLLFKEYVFWPSFHSGFKGQYDTGFRCGEQTKSTTGVEPTSARSLVWSKRIGLASSHSYDQYLGE